MVSPEQGAELIAQYELLRCYALNSTGLSEGRELVTLLTQGLAAWIRVVLAQPQQAELAPLNPASPLSNIIAQRDWVLALAALVLGRADLREVCHG